jgi:hypothetical protein
VWVDWVGGPRVRTGELEGWDDVCISECTTGVASKRGCADDESVSSVRALECKTNGIHLRRILPSLRN